MVGAERAVSEPSSVSVPDETRVPCTNAAPVGPMRTFKRSSVVAVRRNAT
jgi:hypothetical protein